MAARSGSLRLSAALWAERRLPALARGLQPKPVLPGETGPLGTVYRAATGGPLLVLIGDAGFDPRWLGSALGSALGCVAVVVPSGADTAAADADADESSTPDAARVRAAIAEASALGADPELVAVLGVAHGCSAALITAADDTARVSRLVLLTPTSAGSADLQRVPPTFLQSSPLSPALAVSRSLEIDLREAGVAVRPVEYGGLPDAWVRYPRFTPGSKRALEDIVAFLRRGFGMAGTFPAEIPGWDLK